jgi:hypothetical protein
MRPGQSDDNAGGYADQNLHIEGAEALHVRLYNECLAVVAIPARS